MPTYPIFDQSWIFDLSPAVNKFFFWPLNDGLLLGRRPEIKVERDSWTLCFYTSLVLGQEN